MQIDAMIIFALIFFGVVVVLYLPVFLVLRKQGVGILRQVSYLLFAWSLLLIIFVTIFFMPPTSNRILNLTPFYWFRYDRITRINLLETIGNVVMFIPFGFLLPVVFAKTRKFYVLVITVFLMSFSIELIQYFIGRIADIDDLIENVVGGMFGFGLFAMVNHRFINRIWWKKMKGVV